MASKLIVLLSLALLGCAFAAPTGQPTVITAVEDEENVPVIEEIEVIEEIPVAVKPVEATTETKEPVHQIAKRSALRGDNPSNDLLANFDGLLMDNGEFGLDGRRIKFLPTWLG